MKRASSSNPYQRLPQEEIKAAGISAKRPSGSFHNEYPFNTATSSIYSKMPKPESFRQNYSRYSSSLTKPYQSLLNSCPYGINCYRMNPEHVKQYHPPNFQPNIQHNVAPIKELKPKRTSFYHFSHDIMNKEKKDSQMSLIAGKRYSLLDALKAIEKLSNLNSSLLTDFIKSLPADQRKTYQEKVLPTIANFVLKTPILFPTPESLPLLSQESTTAVHLTREQCACLVANMFMCTTIDQHNSTLNRRFHFADLYARTGQSATDDMKKQKIACVLNYFSQISGAPSLTDRVTFRRLYLDHNHPDSATDIEAWKNCRQTLTNVQVDSTRKIEDVVNCAEVDFANKFLGGGVLGQGAVQGEIQFITRPEQLAGLLFCESMTDKEAILIQGAKMYSRYKGYSSSFTFQGPNSSPGESKREVIAMDALDFSSSRTPQFSEIAVLRELNKAYVAFYGGDSSGGVLSKKPISTGNWGCGAFKGDMQLKFIIQWIAASRAKRRLLYHPLNQVKFCEEAKTIVNIYKEQPVGLLVKDVLDCSQRIQRSHSQTNQLFECLRTLRKERARL